MSNMSKDSDDNSKTVKPKDKKQFKKKTTKSFYYDLNPTMNNTMN